MSPHLQDFGTWAHCHADVLTRWEDRGAPDAPVDDSDLEPLRDMVGEAVVVGIGETVHHTHDFLALRERLVRFLVERMGFDTIVLEAVRPGPNLLNAHIAGAPGSVETALIGAGARMWRNRETARILNWAASYNRSNPARRLRIAGMDVLAPGESMRSAITALRPAEAKRQIALSRGFDTDGLSDQIYYNGLSAADRELLRATFVNAPARDGALGEAALVAAQALEILEIGTRGWTASIARRDAAMAQNVRRLIDGKLSRRLIVLSHNMHVCAASRPQMALGTWLRELLGYAYCAIGTAYGEARFDPPIYGVSIAPGAGDDTIDQRIRRDCAFLLNLRGDRPAFLDTPMRLQTIEPGAASSVCYSSIADAFDVLAFVPRLGNAQQLIDTELALDIAAIDATRA